MTAVEKKRKRTQENGENVSSKRKASSVLPPLEPPRHQVAPNTFMFRASRAIQLTVKPRSNVTITVEKWLPENYESSDHKWVPHSIPQVRQGAVFSHVRLEGPAAKHLRLLEENYEAGIYKFSIQGETPQTMEKPGQIRTYAAYHFTIKGFSLEGAKVADIYVFTKTNHVAAGPQTIDFLSAESKKDALPNDEDKTFTNSAPEKDADNEEEEEEEEGYESEDAEDLAEEEPIRCIPTTPIGSWPSPSVIQVVSSPVEREDDEEGAQLYVNVLCSSLDDEISETLLLENKRGDDSVLLSTTTTTIEDSSSSSSSQNNFDVDSLLDFGVVEEFCKPVR